MSTPRDLWIPPAEMRRLGYAAVDHVVELWETLRESPPTGGGDRAAMERLFREPLPREGDSLDTLMERFVRDMVPNSTRPAHPRFFAFVPGSPVYPAVLGDFLAAGANLFAGSWLGSPAAATVELVVLDWFKEMLGLPAESEGLLVSGGSTANWTALAAARGRAAERLASGAANSDAESAAVVDVISRGTFYTSDQRHASVDRAVRLLGFPREAMRIVPADSSFRTPPDAFEKAIREDRAAGRMPLAIVAHAGTTNTGAVDPLEALADLAAAQGLWLHVDAAYGGFAALTARGRELLAGLDRADSVALDPHKWLFQTFECGCVLAREPGRLARTFSLRADYMREVPTTEAEVTFTDRGLQLSRSFRALKVWLTLKAYGVDALAAAIDRALDLTQLAARLLEKGGFEIVAPPVLGIVAFRLRGAPDAAQNALIERVNRGGEVMLTSTTLCGAPALRLCILSPWTTEEDVRRTVELLVQ